MWCHVQKKYFQENFMELEINRLSELRHIHKDVTCHFLPYVQNKICMNIQKIIEVGRNRMENE